MTKCRRRFGLTFQTRHFCKVNFCFSSRNQTMLGVKINVGNELRTIYSTDKVVTADEISGKVTELTGIALCDFYIVHNGRLACDSHVCKNGTAEIVPRILGGKGGFGSMLRAIGAQIEKTTNREACRDLSGRRLRDINEEKRLKSWIDKQGTREEEAVERKKKKLERLCAQPKHEFKDKNYEKERSTLTEKVGDAVEEGFKLAMAAGSGTKRKHEEKTKTGRKKLVLDLDIDSDELGSSSDESESESLSERRVESLSSQDCSEVVKSEDVKSKQSEEESHEIPSSTRQSEVSDNSANSNDSDLPIRSLIDKEMSGVQKSLTL